MSVQGVPVDIDLSRIPGPHKHIALVPQWDFLELLATAAQKEPSFRLLRNTEVLEPLHQSGVGVVGVRYRGPDGQIGEMRADLTVACDGRGSALRAAMGLRPSASASPPVLRWRDGTRNARGET
jgi:2-polyprenyl-6-methoxyphenol hydroxylase-like FAD-dependent oxidoreductase